MSNNKINILADAMLHKVVSSGSDWKELNVVLNPRNITYYYTKKNSNSFTLEKMIYLKTYLAWLQILLKI